MPRLHERVETALALDETFDFIADFANSMAWDPGTVASRRIDDGPLAPGARYRLDVRMGRAVRPMEYRITELDRPRLVVLEGEGSGVSARDEISFEETPAGTVIVDYTADLRLTGLLRFIQPFLGRAFDSIGKNAAAGMRRTLSELEAEHEARVEQPQPVESVR